MEGRPLPLAFALSPFTLSPFTLSPFTPWLFALGPLIQPRQRIPFPRPRRDVVDVDRLSGVSAWLRDRDVHRAFVRLDFGCRAYPAGAAASERKASAIQRRLSGCRRFGVRPRAD